jgi:hypothetical protein
MRGTTMLAAVLILGTTACADEVPRQSPPEFVEPVPPGGQFLGEAVAGQEPAHGTPSDGYLDWTAALRGGLDRVIPMAHTERDAALRMIQDLYSSRHEYLELYFGHGGVMFVGDALAEAVARSAAEFHALMALLADVDEDPNRLEDTVRAAHQALYDIETEGGAAGLRPTAPHRN